MRLFVGLALPPDLVENISRLMGGIEDARWTTPDNLHLTLTYIGEVSENMLDDVDEALAGVMAPGFDLHVKGTGSFAQGDDPKVLWLGVGDNIALHGLKKNIDRALDRYDINFERRKYTPHVTLARFRQLPDEQKVTDFLQAHNGFDAKPFAVSEFILFNSHNGKNGPVYEPLEFYPLGEF